MLPNWMKAGADKARPRRASAERHRVSPIKIAESRSPNGGRSIPPGETGSPQPGVDKAAKRRDAPGTPPVTERHGRVSPVKTAESRPPNGGGGILGGRETGSPHSSDRESESEGGPSQAPVLFAEPPVAGPILVCPLCSSTLRDSGGYQARDDVAIPSCNHAYCAPCLTSSVAAALAEGSAFECNGGQGCGMSIASWEVQPE